MSQEGQRHAAELKRLEDKKKDLEDALGRLARDEAEAQEVAELAQEVEQLEQHVETARAAADMEKTMTKNELTRSPVDVRKAAAINRQAAERQLDELAKQMQQPGETFHKAYDQALSTDMGRALMRSRDDAQELERGGVTSMELDEARKQLMA
ncbi:hypothetical protein [uncultured Roseobacter sp.]|uniref:hypothetical protein n=1 Tax=uncultured Roseobacter sp. TaxID=114847 RepID=UPI00260DAC58|nr:hypothetical protein [uncultured Roseobacter sp.]